MSFTSSWLSSGHHRAMFWRRFCKWLKHRIKSVHVYIGASLATQLVKKPPAVKETRVRYVCVYMGVCMLSHSAVSDSLQHHGLQPTRLLCPWDSPGKDAGVGSCSLLQGIFLTQGLNPSRPHCRWILYHLGQQGNKWTLEWVAYPFSRGSSWPRNRTGVPCIVRGFFTSWATREARTYMCVFV